MASNFTMRFKKKNGNLRIILKGDFDGSSAKILFEALKRNCDERQRISVDTSGLWQIYGFGRDVFQQDLYSLREKSANIFFTGSHMRVFSGTSPYAERKTCMEEPAFFPAN